MLHGDLKEELLQERKTSKLPHTLRLRGEELVLKRAKIISTRSSWLNCALRDDEAVFWVSIGHYEAVAVGN